jgi:peptidoglycan/xylan/chitin deacetylase (PgdA/CDA1 family)
MFRKSLFALCGLLLVFLSACTTAKTVTVAVLVVPEQIQSLAPTRTPGPTVTVIPAATQTQTLTPTQTVTPTPELELQGPGTIVCPILLYHHLGDTESTDPNVSEYFVGVAQFTSEMQTLYDLGFRTITITQLADAIRRGGFLPEKSVVITFDDGFESVNTIAYPIMESFGFIGVTYVPARVINVPGYESADELKQLVSSGWEVGSHSFSHPFLTKSSNLTLEIGGSKAIIEKLIGSSVSSFAYPYGDTNADVTNRVAEYYSSGAGLGDFVRQGAYYYLSRRPILRNTPIATFIGYLLP